MQAEIIAKEAFAVIGIMGSDEQGEGFVQRLWQEANSRFAEVQPLALRDENGVPCGCWGAMSDGKLRFLPWEEDFTRGLYLAGVECAADAVPPEGWTKWILPAFRYVKILCENGNTFREGLAYLKEQGYTLAGAVQDFTDMRTGKNYMLFPVERL